MKKLISVISLASVSLTVNALQTDYSALVFGNFNSKYSNSNGPLAIAKNAKLTGYKISNLAKNTLPEDNSLIVGGDLKYQRGVVNQGSIIVQGRIEKLSTSVEKNLQVGASITDYSTLPIDFKVLETLYIETSKKLIDLDLTGSTEYKWGAIHLSGDCENDVQVFSIDGTKLKNAYKVDLQCVPENATIVVNIEGEKSSFQLNYVNLNAFEAYSDKTIFNFSQAENVKVAGSLPLLLLAPNANVIASQGISKTGIIARKFKGSIKLQYQPFQGILPWEKEAQPITAQVKWKWDAPDFMPEFNQVMITPVVAQLNDDNLDGFINNQDVADIIITTYKGKEYTTPSIVRALSGIDGQELWNYDSILLADPRFSPAVADLDGDGIIEVLVADGKEGVLRIANNNGVTQKVIPLIDKSIGNITISDINNDGIAEILVGKSVIDASGQLLFSHSWSADSIAFDSNNNGKQEILAAGSLFDSNGQLLWQFTGHDTPWFSSVANFDTDPQPEIVVSIPGVYATEHTIALLEHNGNVKWRKDGIKNHGGGAQAVSNFLGNNKLGIVYAGYTSVDMLDANGDLVWQYAMDDMGSGKIGLSSYDFNDNGRDEVIIQDHYKVAIVDGLTGKELYQVPNSTATLWEYPIVVDLEGDNNAEMIIVSNNQVGDYNISTGVLVYESADINKPWVNATRIWNQHSFHMTNINQDGTIPRIEKNSWLNNNSYRSSTIKKGNEPVYKKNGAVMTD
ncbi:choice-of-anchor A family protein [Psychromonas sp. Urea-02u-13]|uniref:choice-of-anchor A family protein n=1 Tax=Psychromonas sp. Urea-02u-13 TaxID=2058326 RepID=UPI0018E2AE8C|nr:choice-of-anchor A family protein [Psychromonas sp. Urea-02u-13]